MQSVRAAFDYGYDSVSGLIKCLLLFFSTLLMNKPSDEFTRDDASDILNGNNQRNRRQGGFGGNNGTSSNLTS